jgi:2-dehydropantoate 2-reductase
VDPGGTIAAAIPGKHIVGCVVHASCSLNGPGYVKHHFGNKLIIGEPSGEKTARVEQLTALLAKAGFEAVLSEQIQKDAWYKLWGNMTVNPVSAMTGATTDLIMGDDLVRGFISAVMLEAKEIGARIGIPIAQQPEDRHQMTLQARRVQNVHAAGRGSRPRSGTGCIGDGGERAGGADGVPTPFTDALLGLSRLHARMRGLY